MSELFYTPELSEFHEGFEYEIFEDFDSLPEKSWHKQVYSAYQRNPENIGYVGGSMDEYRVPYLTKTDIEAEGWKDYNCGWRKVVNHEFLEYEYFITSAPEHIYTIQLMRANLKTLFDGTIKNKSEFKKLLKQLGI